MGTMKMNKLFRKFGTIFFILSLLITSVSAYSVDCFFPKVIVGSAEAFADGTVVEGRDALESTLGNSPVVSGVIQDKHYQLEIANIGQCTSNQKVEVSIKGCILDSCKQVVTLSSNPYDTVNFLLEGDKEVITEYVEVVKEVPCDEKECAVPTIDSESGTGWLVMLLVALFSLAGGAGIYKLILNNYIFTGKGTGIKTYRGLDGKLKLHHKHSGTSGYHDPDIVHKKPENHPKGKIDVSNNYHQDEKGNWYYKE